MDNFEKENKKINNKKVAFIITPVILILLLIIITIVYNNNDTFKNWMNRYILETETYQDNTINIKIDNIESSNVCIYDKYITVLRKKNVELYNTLGNLEASIEVEINSPIFKSKGRYLAIAEKNGKKIYLISNKEIVWEKEIEGEISDVTINRNGYVAVTVSNTTYKTVINVYDSKGKELFKIFLADTRVVDVSISKDSKYVAVAEVDTSGTTIQSNIKIISVEEAQKQTDSENSVKFIYKAPKDKLIVNLEYQNDLVCMYNDSIDIISNFENKEVFTVEGKKIVFMAIELDNDVLAVEEKFSSMFNADSYLSIINSSNGKQRDIQIKEIAKQVYTAGNKIIFNLGTELHVYNTDGKLIKKYIAKQEINDVIASNSMIGIIFRDKIELINI